MLQFFMKGINRVIREIATCLLVFVFIFNATLFGLGFFWSLNGTTVNPKYDLFTVALDLGYYVGGLLQ